MKIKDKELYKKLKEFEQDLYIDLNWSSNNAYTRFHDPEMVPKAFVDTMLLSLHKQLCDILYH
jgi:hypothetical protein